MILIQKPFKMKTKTKKGTSLLELSIVIAVTVIASSAVLVSLTSSRNKNNLRASQRELTATLRLAQSYALQGKLNNGTPSFGYGVEFLSPIEYRIVSCSDVSCSTIVGVESRKISGGVSLTSPPPGSSRIIFFTPHGRVSAPVAYTLSVGGEARTTSVGTTGAITEN